MWKSDIRPPRCSRWMMNVGLEISVGSIPRPEAIPRARTVLPAPSSPQSANTSFGRADRPRRSPRRSVWSEEWLTRSTETTSRRAATRRSAVVFAALKDDPDGNAEERSEERGPYREKPLARDRAEDVDAGIAAKRADERDEPERSDQTLPSPGHRARLAVGGNGRAVRRRERLTAAPNDRDREFARERRRPGELARTRKRADRAVVAGERVCLGHARDLDGIPRREDEEPCSPGVD